MTRFETMTDRSPCMMKKTNGETLYSIKVDTTNKTTYEAIQALTRVLMDADNEKPVYGTIYFKDGSTEDIVKYHHCKLDDTVDFTSRSGMRYEFTKEEGFPVKLHHANGAVESIVCNDHKFVYSHNGNTAPIKQIHIRGEK